MRVNAATCVQAFACAASRMICWGMKKSAEACACEVVFRFEVLVFTPLFKWLEWLRFMFSNIGTCGAVRRYRYLQ